VPIVAWCCIFLLPRGMQAQQPVRASDIIRLRHRDTRAFLHVTLRRGTGGGALPASSTPGLSDRFVGFRPVALRQLTTARSLSNTFLRLIFTVLSLPAAGTLCEDEVMLSRDDSLEDIWVGRPIALRWLSQFYESAAAVASLDNLKVRARVPHPDRRHQCNESNYRTF